MILRALILEVTTGSTANCRASAIIYRVLEFMAIIVLARQLTMQPIATSVTYMFFLENSLMPIVPPDWVEPQPRWGPQRVDSGWCVFHQGVLASRRRNSQSKGNRNFVCLEDVPVWNLDSRNSRPLMSCQSWRVFGWIGTRKSCMQV